MVRAQDRLNIFAAAIEEMNTVIKATIAMDPSCEPKYLREKLSLEIIPFRYAKKAQVNIKDLPKDDDYRLAFQVLFLFVLRPYLPLKCS
jgi:hypothetical protein